MIFECVEEGGPRPVAVVTCLNAFAMPLIRYRLGDLCESVAGDCPCGCVFPRIGAPEGRGDDMMVLPSGRLESPWRLQAGMRDFGEVDQFRFVQETPDGLTVLVSVRAGWTPERSEALRQELVKRISEPVRVEVRGVEFMPVIGGKFQNFVSKVPREIPL